MVDAHVMLDRETSRNKGFGFVTFEDASGVDRAMQGHNLVLEGRPVCPRVTLEDTLLINHPARSRSSELNRNTFANSKPTTLNGSDPSDPSCRMKPNQASTSTTSPDLLAGDLLGMVWAEAGAT